MFQTQTIDSKTMKTANTFYWTFIETLIINVATIAAIVVGVVQYAVNAFNENEGKEKVRKVTQTVLRFVDKIITTLQENIDTDRPVVQVSTTSTKSTRKVQ